MLRRFNSLSARLILITVLSTSLVLSLGAVGWRAITRLISINESIGQAEDQENRLLTIQTLTHNVIEPTNQQDVFVAQIRTLMADFETNQEELHQKHEPEINDPAIAQVVNTIHDTESQWQGTRALLNEFLSGDSTAARKAAVDRVGQSITNTNVYANRTSESFSAVAERERQNVLWTGAIVGVLTLASVAFIVSLIIDVVREMSGLTGVAHTLTGGDYSARAATQGLSEIATLGGTFNRMAESIQEREADLRELNEDLEQRVDQRTAELKAAIAEAREASRAKDEFLSVMSHELRTPLNAILGYQGILELMGEFDGENLEMIQRTQANARRLLSLINDMLDISRIEAGRMDIIPSSLNLSSFIQQMESQMQVLAVEKGLEFNVALDDSLPPEIYIDEDALSKIVINLLGNAFKFTDKGKVDLSMTSRQGNVIVVVSDSGIGVPLYKQETIFERFRQVDSSSTRQHGGSGLGLSIVQQLCQLMGGKVTVASELGRGSTFTVTLPLQLVPEQEEAAIS